MIAICSGAQCPAVSLLLRIDVGAVERRVEGQSD